MKTLVVIPAYNEALNIEKTVHDLEVNAPDVDYVVVNDGSKDNTLEVLKKNHFSYIDGFYDVVIQFDGDGQHSAKYIEPLVKEIENGNSIVIGSRFVDEKKPFTARMIGSRFIAGAIKLVTGKTITDPTSGFRAYDRACIKDYALEMNNPPEPDTLVYMLRKQRKIKEIQVQMSEREFGESYLNLVNTIKYMSRMMVSIFLIQPFRKVK